MKKGELQDEREKERKGCVKKKRKGKTGMKGREKENRRKTEEKMTELSSFIFLGGGETS